MKQKNLLYLLNNTITLFNIFFKQACYKLKTCLYATAKSLDADAILAHLLPQATNKKSLEPLAKTSHIQILSPS